MQPCACAPGPVPGVALTTHPTTSLRALPFRRPDGPARPRPFELAVSRIEEGLRAISASTANALWDVLRASPVYVDGQARDRQRRMRSDGARNLATLISTLVMQSDPRGFLGSLGEAGWRRLQVRLFDYRAFGDQVPGERSMRRTERWLRVLAEAGFLETRQITVVRDGEYRSPPAVRHLTEKFWRLIGAWNALRALVRERERTEGKARAERLATIGQRGASKRLTVHSGPGPGPVPSVTPCPSPPAPPPATAPPGAGGGYATAMEALRKIGFVK